MKREISCVLFIFVLIALSCSGDKKKYQSIGTYIEPTLLFKDVKNHITEKINYSREGELKSKEITVKSMSRSRLKINMKVKYDYLGNIIESSQYQNGKLHLKVKERFNEYNLSSSVLRLDFNPNSNKYDTTSIKCVYNKDYTRGWRITNGDTIVLLKLSYIDTLIKDEYLFSDTLKKHLTFKTLRDKDYNLLYYKKIYHNGLSDKIINEYDQNGKLQQRTTHSEDKVVSFEKFKKNIKTEMTITKYDIPIFVKYKQY